VPLTPLQAQGVEFGRSANGYDPEQVDRLLDEVVAGYEEIWLERIELQQQLDELLDVRSRRGRSGGRRRFLRRSAVALAILVMLAVAGAVAWQLELVRWPGSPQATPSHPAKSANAGDSFVSVSPKSTEHAPTGQTEPAPPSRATNIARLQLTASRGSCWLLVRERSASGKALFIGTLAQGRSIRFKAKRLWLRFGAAQNLDVRLNDRPIAGLPDTGAVSVTARGVDVLANA